MGMVRRDFLRGAALGTLLAALPPGARIALGATTGTKDALLFVILRGGMDGLNLLAPVDDANLNAARPKTLLPATGFPLANGLTKQDWRLHPSAPELQALYQAGHLALVPASGTPAASRSHFEMQQLAECGVTDLNITSQFGGWVGRYANATAVEGTFAAMACGEATLPLSISDDLSALCIANAASFAVSSAQKLAFLEQEYGAAAITARGLAGALARQAMAGVNAVQRFETINSGYVRPATYGTDTLATGLAIAAELMKQGAGLQLGVFEYDNWDTHVNQEARFAPAVAILSQALGAFWNDINSTTTAGVTLIVMSEFGRRIVSNASGGTDHGHGNVMLVLSNAVAGGRMYGAWPGLAPAETDLGDVAITTDARQVILEAITARRHDAPANLFPGLQVQRPLNLFAAH
ncbi:hypothetical protein GCM10011611_32880 [Aliidongia dinghuensis]|uniref:DUF1501 domain-containing protein n=1 Tax=Aliidongia dinghuensis TaxID=1867774 RepID=A0A8J2YUT4_9PROT|nr:DUF1501 domain-containing protein [Aliidongia dinghuensis]GGF24267.1 hypothetical protein GCM10011611_32880 [Aliidongia dinghuensis]